MVSFTSVTGVLSSWSYSRNTNLHLHQRQHQITVRIRFNISMRCICYHIVTYQNLRCGIGLDMVYFVSKVIVLGMTLTLFQGKSCRMCSSTTRSSLHLSVALRHEPQKNNPNASHSSLFYNHYHSHAQFLATITSQRPELRTRVRPSTTSMATPQFPSRPFPGLGRTSTVGQQQQQQAPPNANTYQPPGYGGSSNAFNDRGGAGPGQRERQERERAERERIERERRDAEERAGALDALSEEQREEINEAVSPTLDSLPLILETDTKDATNHSFPSSI
jgi:hypothetical protein